MSIILKSPIFVRLALMTLKEIFQDDQHKWNAIYSLFFIVLTFVLVSLVWLVDDRFPKEVSVFDFIILSLAVFRLIRLFVYDKITLFLRDYFASATHGPKKTASELLNCPWCFGVWLALMTVFFYYVLPMAWVVILVLAISGVATFLQIIMNSIGWRAELNKIEAQNK